MNKIKYLVSFIFILLVNITAGQQFYTHNFNINNGLPDNTISVIFKDSRGLLWLGTNAGLARFDGIEFTVFSSLDGLAGNTIKSITEDKDGNIWIGCFNGGLSKYNGAEFENLTQQEGIINNQITKIKAVKDHNLLLIGTTDGISVYDGNGISSYHNSLNNIYQRLDVTDFFENKNSIYVLTKSSGLYEFFPKTRELKKVIEKNSLNYPSVFTAFTTNQNDTLISIGRSGFLLKNQQSTFFKNIGYVECFASDNKNKIWIGTSYYEATPNGGIYLLENNKIINFNNQLGIESKQITSLLFDKEENLLWIGTADNGLYSYAGNTFTYYKADEFDLKEMKIKDLHLDRKNTLWILTNRNLINKQPNDKFTLINLQLFIDKFNYFKATELKNKYQYLIDKYGSHEKYERLIANKLYNYPNPYILIESNQRKIIPSRNLFKPNKYDIMLQKSINEFTNIQSDTNNLLWIGTNTGIFRFNPLTNEIRYFDLEDNFFTSFTISNDNKIIATEWNNTIVYESLNGLLIANIYPHNVCKSPVNITRTKKHKDKIWFLGTDHFLFLYDTNKFHQFENPDSSGNNGLNDICFDSNNHIITGGSDGKLYIMELIDNKLKINYTFSKLNGLAGTNIKWINCAPDDKLYIGTNIGVNIIDLKELYSHDKVYVKKLDKSYGYINYSGFVSVLDTNNELWIGADKEIIRINTKNIYENGLCNCRLNLKSIEVNNEQLKITHLNPNTKFPLEPIVLPWYKNSIKFSFDIIKFLNPENVLLSYTLKGNNKFLTQETSERQVSFQNLHPGNYEFIVSIIPEKDQNLSNAIAIQLVIKDPLYKNWWAISIFLFMLSILVWGLANWRTKQFKHKERKRFEIAEKIAELELKALRAQMNPHFIFNAINSIQNYMLGNDVDSALSYLSDFAKLIRITLDNVSKKFVTLEEELNYLKYYLSLEHMRFDKKFEAFINVPNEFDYNKILIPPMIIQPFIENSIKHGFANKLDKGLIKIDFFITGQDPNSELHCIIEDNGIGRVRSKELNLNQSTKQKSRGTKITSERLALLNQTHQRKGYKISITDLYNEDNDAYGTKVDITFPI